MIRDNIFLIAGGFLLIFIVLVSGCLGGATVGENIDLGLNKTIGAFNDTIEWIRG